MKYNKEEWIGKKYGLLTVVGIESATTGAKRQTKRYAWNCVCDCGNERTVDPVKLLTGHAKTCGCGKSRRIAEYNIIAKTKHGGRHERLYAIWHGMKQRCYWSGCRDYKTYGARGIEICDEWLNDYQSFRTWALGNGYEDNLSIDRIDTNGNYSPDNCRWATCYQQQNNRRTCVYYDYNGERMTVSEISRIVGIKKETIYNRINGLGWDPQRAFSTPVDKTKANHVI